ncbi:MAG: preprotein translocase subunit SecG [Bacteroidales bacterium]|nr:preprotein translocase subunit SecG [Bacteroidales bacterium]
MNAVFVILVVLIVLASILLIGVVLLQNSKGGGLASNFVAGNQTFGVRQTADLLEKITWALVTFILVVSIIASFTVKGGRAEGNIDDRIENTTTATGELEEFPSAPIDLQNPANE